MVRKVPMRKCLGCLEMKEKKSLIRVVRSNEGTYDIDLSGKKNGRGAYVCKQVACFNKAEKSKGLERAFKEKIPTGVYEALRKEIEAIE
jgi:predicted RNA-binding protein YlxR (DUF448 family)